MRPEEPEEDEADLFGAPAPAADAALPPTDHADSDRELAAMLTPGRAPAAAAETPLEPSFTDGRLTLERVLQAWPRFLQETERISKQAAVMLEKAVPTGITGKTVAITFTARMNYEMMSLPKKQEFVRKLLARTLGIDSVSLHYSLDPNAVAPPKPGPRNKVRRERDLVAALDAPPLPIDGAPAPAAPPPSIFAAPAAPARSLPATVNGAGDSHASDAPEAKTKTSPHAAALEDPFVQEALSIFGGEIVGDG